MARKSSTQHGNGQLETAMATLIQTQTAFLARLSETDQRFARIETDMNEILRMLGEQGLTLKQHSRILEELSRTVSDHSRILSDQSRILSDHTKLLSDHTRILEAIPDAVKAKFGFPPPPD